MALAVSTPAELAAGWNGIVDEHGGDGGGGGEGFGVEDAISGRGTGFARGTVSADLTYQEVLTGQTHHAAYFRLQVDDTVVDGMDYIRLDAEGKIAEVTIWWRPLPAGVQMQGHLAGFLGMRPWELRTDTE
ncbi:MAG: hypothetical protein ABWY45_16595 [Mycobacterium sp.]